MGKLTIFVVAGTILIAVLLIFGFGKTDESGQGKIEISPKEYNFGDISMAAGPAKKTFEIKNNSDAELKIDKIWTSCDCTSARLKTEERESPEFSMHTEFPFWSETLTPGQTGYLETTFDPAFHGPSGTGQITRIIYLSTSDPQNKKIEVKLEANVVH